MKSCFDVARDKSQSSDWAGPRFPKNYTNRQIVAAFCPSDFGLKNVMGNGLKTQHDCLVVASKTRARYCHNCWEADAYDEV